jgi:hypothetical protein
MGKIDAEIAMLCDEQKAEKVKQLLEQIPSIFVSEEDFHSSLELFLDVRIREFDA